MTEKNWGTGEVRRVKGERKKGRLEMGE